MFLAILLVGPTLPVGAHRDAAASAVEGPILQEQITVFVYGYQIVGHEHFVTNTIGAGDQVLIQYTSGQVTFNTTPPQTCVNVGLPYATGADGLARSVYLDPNNSLCYSWDRVCDDPLTGASQGHAGLYMMRNAAKTFIGAAGASYTASGNETLYLGVMTVRATAASRRTAAASIQS